MGEEQKVVAIGLLTRRDIEILGKGFTRLFPIERTSAFDDLLRAIDDADGQRASTSEGCHH